MDLEENQKRDLPPHLEDWILKLVGVSLSFRPEVHRMTSWRDVFTQSHRRTEDEVPKLVHVARSVDLEIRAGERIGLLGVNGAGKTSLCRMIAGMYQPTAGVVHTRGHVRAIFDTRIGILPELTGRENAHLLSHFLFPGDPSRASLIEEALEFSELGRFLDVPFKNYSNGMQAKLSLSLISAKPSDLLILDEVFAGADQFFYEKASRRVLKMIENSGAVVFVSHSAEQISRACNRVVVLNEGRIAFDGAVSDGLKFYTSLKPVSIAP